jgi:cytosine/adenosine deaminase-related metal-dependent hydrolase
MFVSSTSKIPYLLLRAAWIYPMDRPPVRDGGVVFSGGKISDLGDGDRLARAHPAAIVRDLGEVVLLPGLVNAHAHLELSTHVRGGPPASFVDWLTDLMGRLVDPTEAVKLGVAQSLRFGVTSIGDISRQCAVTRPLLAGGPLRIVSYGEVQAMAQRRGLLEERFAVASDTTNESERLRVGVTPHAPYSIEPAGYARCLDFAIRANRPIATHLAETPAEANFLGDQSGPFRELWDVLNAWDEQVPRFLGGPIRYAKSLGLLDYPTLLAHVNYCDDEEMSILAHGKASVVYCPRTHAYFGHPPHRWRTMLDRGINVAVGTDSCASSPDLNLLDDLRLLRKIAPEMPAEDIFALATLRAARAIGMEDSIGSLTPGKYADVVAIPAKDLDEVLNCVVLPSAVWIGGERMEQTAPS